MTSVNNVGLTMLTVFAVVVLSSAIILIFLAVSGKFRRRTSAHVSFKTHMGVMNQYGWIASAIQKAKDEGRQELYFRPVSADVGRTRTTQLVSELFDLEEMSKTADIKLLDATKDSEKKADHSFSMDSFDHFNHLSTMLIFTPEIQNRVQSTFEKIIQHVVNKTIVANSWCVLHLKLGQDSVNYYSDYLHMSTTDYELQLRTMYCRLIRDFIPRTVNLIVCISNKNDIILSWLKNRHPLVLTSQTDTTTTLREVNAAVDLNLIHRYFSDSVIAILNCSEGGRSGSTFSSWLDLHCAFKSRYYVNLDIAPNDPRVVQAQTYVHTPISRSLGEISAAKLDTKITKQHRKSATDTNILQKSKLTERK